MKKFFLVVFVLASFSLKAQKNLFLEPSFWKEKPDVAAVKAAIEKNNDPLAFNNNSFDATTLAINGDAPNETVKYLVELPGSGVKRITHDSRIYLHWAAMKGNVELVEYLLAKGSDYNLEDSHGTTPIAFAANGGQQNIALYEAFFKAGIDPKKRYKGGVNLLLMGIANDKDLTLSNYFVSKGMSFKDVDEKGNTAFNYAARSGNIELLKTLVKKGVKYNENALVMAAQGTRRGANGIEVYKYLVEDLKLKPTVANPAGENVLHILARRPKQAEIVTYFLAKGVDVNKADEEGNNVFMNAAAGRDVELLGLLLPKVKNINAVNAKGESALTGAIKTSSGEVVDFLIKNAADINVIDKDGNNLAYYLVQSYRSARGGGPMAGGPGAGPQRDDFADKLKLLQDNGLNFTAAQKDGSSLYHVAIVKNDVGLLKKISALNVDVNAKNKEGLTALHKAAMISKDDAILKYLLSVGAKKETTTEFEETALDLARENESLTKNKVSLDFLQ